MKKGEYKDTFDAVRAGVVEFLGGDDSRDTAWIILTA